MDFEFDALEFLLEDDDCDIGGELLLILQRGC